MQIRKAKPEDADALRELGLKTFVESFGAVNTEENIRQYLSHAFSPEEVSRQLGDQASEFFMVFSEEQNPVGYLKINHGNAQTELQNVDSLEIERIYILQEYQGQKIGQLLFDKAMEIAHEHQYKFVWLGVWENNPGAIRFYERNGFKIFDEHKFFLGSEEQTDLMMRKEL